jgi:hypothetical protein
LEDSIGLFASIKPRGRLLPMEAALKPTPSEIRFRNSGTIIPAGIFDQDKGVREEREMGKVLLLVMAISVAALIGITAFIIQL